MLYLFEKLVDKACCLNVSIIKLFKEKFTIANPTYDLTFKMLFGQNEDKGILIDLLNCLLDLDEEGKIINVYILPCDVNLESREAVSVYIDVRCKTSNNEEIAVEMQRSPKPYFLARSQHYMSRLISKQAKIGESALYLRRC